MNEDDDDDKKTELPLGKETEANLFKSRSIFIYGPINQELAQKVCSQLVALAAASDEEGRRTHALPNEAASALWRRLHNYGDEGAPDTTELDAAVSACPPDLEAVRTALAKLTPAARADPWRGLVYGAMLVVKLQRTSTSGVQALDDIPSLL